MAVDPHRPAADPLRPDLDRVGGGPRYAEHPAGDRYVDRHVDRPVEDRSATALIGDLFRQIPDLFRKETHLLRAELSEKSSQALRAVGMITAGLVLALTALNVLAFTLVAAIENAGLAPGWAALIVGGVIAIIAFALVSKGSNDLKASKLAPNRTAHSVQKDADLARGRV